jgi:multidrug resistance efflux pump
MSERDTTSAEKTNVEPVEAALPARRPALPSVPRPSPIGTEPVAIEHSRRRPRVRFIAAIAIIAIGAVAVGQWLFTPTTVTVTSPTHGPAVQAVFATGSVEASVMVPLAGRITARLVHLNADEGDAVTKGQVLARFEDRDV